MGRVGRVTESGRQAGRLCSVGLGLGLVRVERHRGEFDCPFGSFI